MLKEAEKLAEITDIDIAVNMNVPDDSLFDYGFQMPERGSGNPYRTVYHGTVAQRHGVDQAIQAVALLKDRIPGIELLKSTCSFGSISPSNGGRSIASASMHNPNSNNKTKHILITVLL